MTKKFPIGKEKTADNSLWLDDIINKEPRIKIEIYDHKGKSIQKFSDLLRATQDNKLDVILTFDVKKVDDEIEDKEVVTYNLVDFSSRDSYLKNKKIALEEHIYKYKPVTPGAGNNIIVEKNKNGLSNLECKLYKVPNNDSTDNKKVIDLSLKEKGTDDPIFFKRENVRILAYFNLPRKIEFDEVITFPSPEKPKESFWTPLKIIGVIFAGFVITALFYFYRKKIWAWIKREDKEKKREEVEIF